MKQIACIIPLSWSYVPTKFMWSLINLIGYSKSFKLNIISRTICYLDAARNMCVKEALKLPIEYILWLDVDQTYPKETAERLIKHIDSGKMIVGGRTLKKWERTPLVFKFLEDSMRVRQYDKLKGLMKIDAMGMGGVMMRPEVFNIIDYPYFKIGYKDDDHIGEDIYFFRQCKNKNIDVWCDTDLHFGHIQVKP